MLKQTKANVIKANAESLPFKDKSFDVVISITAIHNFNDIESSIKEIKRVAIKKIAISVLKKSKKFSYIKSLIKKHFPNFKTLEEEKDIIFILEPNKHLQV